MNNTEKNRAEKKVQIAIDKMIDLQQDFELPIYVRGNIARILDDLNSLESRILSIETK